MKEMTKAQIQERQLAIWDKIDEMDNLREKRENREFTADESKEYQSLLDESSKLSTRAKALASGAELAKIRENEDKAKELREMIEDCYTHHRAANATTILANAITTGDDQNTTANLDAGGLIPIDIKPIVDTKVPGINLPDDLVMLTGVTGTQVIPYSINDVQFTVEGEVSTVAEQALNFANIKANPQRVAASVPVSRRAAMQAAFDLISFVTFKFQKGWAIFRALHVYAHGEWNKLEMPFATCPVVELTLDQNIGKNLAKEVAKLYDKGFEGDPELIMDKTTEVELAFTPRIPGSTGERTVIEDGRCCGYRYKVSPYIDYSIDADGIATKDMIGSGDNAKPIRYIGIGHFGYLNEQVYADFDFNVDGTSSANFDRGVIALGMGTDYSLVELSKLVNGGDNNNPHKPQAFVLVKLIVPASSSEI